MCRVRMVIATSVLCVRRIINLMPCVVVIIAAMANAKMDGDEDAAD